MRQYNVGSTVITIYETEDFMDSFRAIVDEFGDKYRYLDHFDTCKNFSYPGTKDEKPACAVGQVFHKMGLTHNDCGNQSVVSSVDQLAKTRPDIKFTVGWVLAASIVQNVQDTGGTWGLARTAASSATSYGFRTRLDLDRETF